MQVKIHRDHNLKYGYNLSSLIRQYWKEIGYVQQSPFLFSQSIQDNILLAEETHSLSIEQASRLEYALQAACLKSEVEGFSEGLNTPVGERGVTLSGGQKQRTSLARAFYRSDLRLLLLDDVLSAVDHNTEEQLIQAIYTRNPQCTTLIVSHRMSVLQKADRVIVLENGQLTDQGSPDELLAKDGSYSAAWKAQKHFEVEQANISVGEGYEP